MSVGFVEVSVVCLRLDGVCVCVCVRGVGRVDVACLFECLSV